ncbi:MAG TPA: 4-hydroxybenzoate octaprenyltransferase, partial [Anseongella sp.]|nr:4-hydroxybenzoate octaprenyltransferase [Anseongella sp.]
SLFLHGLSAAFVTAAGILGELNWLYWTGTAVYAGMLAYQHSLVKPHDLSKVNIAFMTSNGIASVVFAAFFLADIFLIDPTL